MLARKAAMDESGDPRAYLRSDDFRTRSDAIFMVENEMYRVEAQLKEAQAKATTEIHEYLIEAGGKSQTTISTTLPRYIGEEDIAAVDKGVRLLEGLVRAPLEGQSVRISQITGIARAFFDHEVNAVGLPGMMPIRTSVIVHELGHWLEAMIPGAKDAAIAFLERRTSGDKLVKMREATGNKSYADDEVTRPDRFLDPYIGKHYQALGAYRATETLSMGLELMATNPGMFASRDPDHFEFVLRTVWGVRG